MLDKVPRVLRYEISQLGNYLQMRPFVSLGVCDDISELRNDVYTSCFMISRGEKACRKGQAWSANKLEIAHR